MYYPTGQVCCVAAVRAMSNSYEYTQHKAKLVSPFPLLSSLNGNQRPLGIYNTCIVMNIHHG